jgi:hypothetical protein
VGYCNRLLSMGGNRRDWWIDGIGWIGFGVIYGSAKVGQWINSLRISGASSRRRGGGGGGEILTVKTRGFSAGPNGGETGVPHAPAPKI